LSDIDLGYVKCTSFGIILKQNDDAVLLVSHIGKSKQNDFDQYCGAMTIPKCSIISVKYLKVLQ